MAQIGPMAAEFVNSLKEKYQVVQMLKLILGFLMKN